MPSDASLPGSRRLRLPWLPLAFISALCLVLAPAPGKAAETSPALRTPAAIRDAVLGKLRYDADYFANILKLAEQGRTSERMSHDEFENEVARARRYQSVLAAFGSEQAQYAAGKPFSLPPADETFRVYTNLLSMLNMLQAFDRGDYAAAASAGARVVVGDREKLGLVRGESTSYYLNLYREFFYMMASTNFRLGRDAEAVAWFQRIESDANLKQLKATLPAQAPASASRSDRLESLRVKPISVLPIAVQGGTADDKWMKVGLAEVLAGDLLNHTDLRLVERTQMDAMLSETKLAVSGLMSDASIQEIGRLLQAGTLIVGSVAIAPSGWTIAVRLVDAETAEILGAASGPATQESVVAALRELTLKVLRSVDFVGEAAASDVAAAHAPSTGTVRALAQARLLLANKGDSAEAKRLYEAAMRDDPAYANLFADLKAKYADIAATIAVAPFVNVTGSAADQWMMLAVQEGLATDLGQLHFHVVERGQLQALLARMSAGEALSPERAHSMGQMLNADIMVLGAITHQAPTLRIDARFVDVQSGSVLLSASVVEKHDDLVAALSELASEVARRFNEPMSEATRRELAAHRPTQAEFESRAKSELAREALGRGVEASAAPVTAPASGPTGPAFPWAGVVTAVVGTAGAATGFALGSQHNAYASYYLALSGAAVSPAERSAYTTQRASQASQAVGWNVGGFVGLALAATGIGIITFDLVSAFPHAQEAANGAARH